jgi:putative membrane protein
MATDSDLLQLVVIIGAVLLLLPVVLMLVMLPTMGGMHAGAWDGGMMGTGGWWLVSSLLPLVVIAGLAYAGYRVLAGDGDESDPAVEELRQAYARGELSDEEYETRMQRLKEDAE